MSSLVELYFYRAAVNISILLSYSCMWALICLVFSCSCSKGVNGRDLIGAAGAGYLGAGVCYAAGASYVAWYG